MAHARRSAILMLLGLAASGTPLPYSAAAVVPLLWAGFESVQAIRAMSAGRAPARAIAWSVVSLVMVAVLALVVLLPYAVYGPAKRLQDCTSAANTAVAAAECKSGLNGGVESYLMDFLDAGR